MRRKYETRHKTIGSVLLLFCTIVTLGVSYQWSIAENGESHPFKAFPLQLGTPSLRSVALQQNALDTPTQELATLLRERLQARHAAHQRQATLAAMAPEQLRTFATLEQRTQTAVDILLRPTTGTPMQIVSPMLQAQVADGVPGPDRDEKTARTFLRTYCNLLRLDNPDHELVMTRHAVDHLQRCHLRFTQQYHNLPVWPSEVIVHLNDKGNVDVVEGAFIPTPRKFVPHPVVTSETAAHKARAVVPGSVNATVSDPELIIHAPVETAPRLAWKMEVTVSDTSRWLVAIDALNGATLTAYNQVTDANVSGSGVDLFRTTRSLNVFSEGGQFFMIDTSKQMYDPTSDPPALDKTRGAIVVLDAANKNPDAQGRPSSVSQVTSNSATSGFLPDAVSASFGLSQTYDYFLERHSRNSLDGQGGTMLAIVRFGANFENASWNGQMMLFGDGLPFAGSLDVVAHELTHGVTQFSANLVYLNQSGALNEAFSDIFGEATEARTNGSGPDWLVGAQLGAPLRNLANPSAIEICPGCGPYPRNMSQFINTSQDNGGVHINSTIIGHAFYLLAQGPTNAIGIRDAERIFYRALTTHVVRNSQFIDARLACIRAATEIFGAGAPQTAATAAVFDQVGIAAAAPTPEPPTLPTINAPDSTLFLRREAGQLLLSRREEGRGDSSLGIRLSSKEARSARPVVSGDGRFAVFVDARNDICLINTDGTEEECLNRPGTVSSVAVSRDGLLFGIVLLDGGLPANLILVIDLRPGQQNKLFVLSSPAIDGVSANTVIFADSMDFSADDRSLIYDAFNEVTLIDGSEFGVWSIYAIDLATNTTQTIFPPTPGIDISFPRFSRTSDNFATFDVLDQDTNQSTVFACKLSTGDCKAVANVNGPFGVPSYTGDDSAIIYSQADSSTLTGFSLFRQPLANDRLTPVGSPTLWLSNADYSVIYRRGQTAPGPGGVALENPASGSVQSGIGLISGWVCNASRIDIDIDDQAQFQAAYGTGRGDTQTACGDANNGFGLLFNWNLLSPGTHRVRILADNVEIASSTFTVATLGLGQFVRGLSGAFSLPDFPQSGRTARVQWQEANQNFVITNAGGSSTGGGSNNPGTQLENPAPGSFQSGLGLISGWVCNASRIDIDIDGRATFQAAYGTGRADTQSACGDTNNGYGLLFNWNLVGDGTHFVRILADDVEVGRSTFTVATLGLGEFLRGLSGTFTVPGFPQSGRSTQIQWQESGQNFVIIGVQ